MVARFRMGNETRSNEYSKKEEERKCRACGKNQETLKHILMECEIIGNREKD